MVSNMKLVATALALATAFSTALANPVAAAGDIGDAANIKTSEPNRCCTPGCQICSTLTCQVEGCKDQFYTSCCNVALRQPVGP